MAVLDIVCFCFPFGKGEGIQGKWVAGKKRGRTYRAGRFFPRPRMLLFDEAPSLVGPKVPKCHKHRVTTPENPRKISRTPAEPSERTPQNPRRDPAEPSERQLSSESLAEGCAPRMVTLRNFRSWSGALFEEGGHLNPKE